jgi:hypothetical protein
LPGFFSPELSSPRTVSIAANPAATAAAFAAFFAVPFTFERVIAPERFLVFATFFWVVLPRVEPLAPARFDDDFAVPFFAFFMFPPKGHLPAVLVAITGSFSSCLNADGQAADQGKRLFAGAPRLSASLTARLF